MNREDQKERASTQKHKAKVTTLNFVYGYFNIVYAPFKSGSVARATFVSEI